MATESKMAKQKRMMKATSASKRGGASGGNDQWNERQKIRNIMFLGAKGLGRKMEEMRRSGVNDIHHLNITWEHNADCKDRRAASSWIVIREVRTPAMPPAHICSRLEGMPLSVHLDQNV